MSARRRPVSNPPNPWSTTRHEWIGPPPEARVEVYEDDARSILARNESPDLPFRWSLNPYRGCFHACAYCYARTTHERLDLGAGTDFDTRLFVKREAPALLQKAFDKRSWRGERVHFSGNTDCYQPLEASYRLTRGCLEVCLEYRNPVSIITKGALIERDVALLAELHQAAGVSVLVSLPLLETRLSRALEPHASDPDRRLQAIRALADAGIPTGVFVAPIIPGLNDREIPEILSRAREAGASFASWTLLRLPGSVEPVFVERLRRALPSVADKVLNKLTEARGGRIDENRFGKRMSGQGPHWQATRTLFQITKRRLGYGESPPEPDPSPFRRPNRDPQLTLFGEDT